MSDQNNLTKDDLEAIRQRDKKGFSEEGRTWDTKRITDTPAQMASDRHALLRYIDELRAAPEPPARRPCHFKAFGLWPCSLEEGHEGSHTIPANQQAEPKAEPGPWHALACACIASVRRGLPMNEAGCDCGALNRGGEQ